MRCSFIAGSVRAHEGDLGEEAQRKEVAALKAMVEVLIDKGVFTREEYLARVKRTGPR